MRTIQLPRALTFKYEALLIADACPSTFAHLSHSSRTSGSLVALLSTAESLTTLYVNKTLPT